METSKDKTLKAEDFDTVFENEDVTEHLNLKSVNVHFRTQRFNIDQSGLQKNYLNRTKPDRD